MKAAGKLTASQIATLNRKILCFIEYPAGNAPIEIPENKMALIREEHERLGRPLCSEEVLGIIGLPPFPERLQDTLAQ